ncbi:hypothetical protein MVEG_01976 [Podila verticillata NRRL 6337]|nr:hypothetical protein MVEG_01976 [Podila verticillata NRRL 6337]
MSMSMSIQPALPKSRMLAMGRRVTVPVTGKCAWAQTRAGHSWISGHPHSILYKSASGSKASVSGSSPNMAPGNTGSAGSGSYSGPSSFSSFLEFAGNSRYQAYNLARFSTFSAASASSSSSSSPNSTSENTSLPSSTASTEQASSAGSDKASQPHSNSAPETQSPTSTTPTSGNPEDKDDDWAVNESYSGHGGHGFVKAAPSSSETTSESNNNIDDSNDNNNSTHNTLPSLTSFKDSAAIQASWRRTSDSIPTIATPGPSLSSQSKAGGLDLSSSTLVQQMLFKERPPHADETSDSDEDKSPKVVESLPSASDSRSTPSLIALMENQTSAQGKKPKADIKDKSPTATNDEEDHISKLDIRVGVVRSVANHPDAESLYIEQVDVGDMDGELKKEPRTIVSGLVRHVPKEYLEGRAVIVVGNMKPSKLRGVMSEGMLLCAMEQDADGQVTKVGLLEPAEGSQPGDKVIFEGYTDQDTVPAPVLTPKRKWFEKSRIHFSVQDGVAYYKGSPFKTVQGLVRCKSISTGQIS